MKNISKKAKVRIASFIEKVVPITIGIFLLIGFLNPWHIFGDSGKKWNDVVMSEKESKHQTDNQLQKRFNEVEKVLTSE
ncbi:MULTISPECIES: hypothetical protein [Staphylococcus]|uniref:hypothetical protein n=1 Tax=Staphylococcus TaxID=1279 RepID=UPI000E3D946C|nr:MULTISPECIES: hypothetical protein [Staphylococcus]MBG3486339.1 hypothetical protein [Staphylococcus aureus]GBY65911.1 hypothetical protein M6K074_2304 [Staphylococcus aureus]GBY65979.1 hypothetical protein M6K074_2372 [Staphylococcus aureus]